jgi:hypothetical protein
MLGELTPDGEPPLFGGALLASLLFLLMRAHKIREYWTLVVLLALLSIINLELFFGGEGAIHSHTHSQPFP